MVVGSSPTGPIPSPARRGPHGRSGGSRLTRYATVHAIDFDGTCVDHRYPAVGPDVPGAVDTMRRIVADDDLLILWTMRSDAPLADAVRWFEEHGLPLHGVNRNPDQHWTNSPKAWAHVYIDDAALGAPLREVPGFHRPCVDWARVAELLGLAPAG